MTYKNLTSNIHSIISGSVEVCRNEIKCKLSEEKFRTSTLYIKTSTLPLH